MKTVIKILIALLVVVALGATAMILVAEGGLMWLKEPVVRERTAPAIPTEETTEATQAPTETQPSQSLADGTADASVNAGEQTGEERVISARNYFIYDLRDEKFLDIKGEAKEKIYPASITKLMTSYVLLQHMKPKDMVVVGADALALVPWDSSRAWLQIEDSLTVEQLIAAMMLPSGNDAARVAAVACGRKLAGNNSLDAKSAEEVFVKEMNKQAKKLGMTGSHWVTPDGMHDENHYTSMQDLITLSKKLLADQTVLQYTSQPAATAKTPKRSMSWKNTNRLLHADNAFYVPSTIGLKTGYTDAAGNCLISAFFEEDRLILIGVFGCPKKTNDRYEDTLALYQSLS